MSCFRCGYQYALCYVAEEDGLQDNKGLDNRTQVYGKSMENYIIF